MKKVRLFLLALATVSFMSFYACGTEEATDDAEAADTEVAAEDAEVDAPAEAEVVDVDSTVEAEATEETAK